VREGAFCAILFQAARKLLILNGEMSEWSIEHAWKAIPAKSTKRCRRTSTRSVIDDLPLQDAG
jgi:hypothetical protein